MPNDIPQRQNEPEFVNRIAASSRAYEIVKSTARLQNSLAVLAALLGPSVKVVYPAASGWAAVFACIVLLADFLYSEPRQKRYRNIGAKVQELFDTKLLDIPWNQFRCQVPPDHEEINRLAEQFKSKESTDRLINWYPTDVGIIPLEFARFVCQRANMRWDITLRRKFAAFFYLLAAAIAVVVIAIALATRWEFSQIIVSFVLPVLPAVVKLVREGKKHLESAAMSEEAKSLLQSIWIEALNNERTPAQLREDARRLQDELFDRRRGSPTVPQWLYLWHKPDFERDMQFATEEMIKQIQARLCGDGS